MPLPLLNAGQVSVATFHPKKGKTGGNGGFFHCSFFDTTPPMGAGDIASGKNQSAVLVAVFLYMKKQSTYAIDGGGAVVVASCIQQYLQPLPCPIAINVE